MPSFLSLFAQNVAAFCLASANVLFMCCKDTIAVISKPSVRVGALDSNLPSSDVEAFNTTLYAGMEDGLRRFMESCT